MLAEQDGVCKICTNPETAVYPQTGKIKNLTVDHCHKTGRVRGLICFSCNIILGHLEDRPEVVHSVLDYLNAKA